MKVGCSRTGAARPQADRPGATTAPLLCHAVLLCCRSPWSGCGSWRQRSLCSSASRPKSSGTQLQGCPSRDRGGEGCYNGLTWWECQPGTLAQTLAIAEPLPLKKRSNESLLSPVPQLFEQEPSCDRVALRLVSQIQKVSQTQTWAVTPLSRCAGHLSSLSSALQMASSMRTGGHHHACLAHRSVWWGLYQHIRTAGA